MSDQGAALTIRLEALDGRWETVGTDRERGVWAEDVTMSANEWGPDSCSFRLRRDPVSVYPDVSAFTPCDIEVDGALEWSGRVRETPTTGDGVQVEGAGWQHHLDDDMYERVYVHNRLTDWQDQRSFLTANLSFYVAAGQVTSDGGVMLAFAKGAQMASGNRVGVTLDLGPDSTAKRLVMEWESSNNASNFTVYMASSPAENQITGATNASFAMNTGASGTTIADLATPRRYLHVFIDYPGATATLSVDVWLKIKSLRAYAETDYQPAAETTRGVAQGGLTVDKIVTDALTRAAPLLSTDHSQVHNPAFNVPHFALAGPQTPREVWSAGNAFHGWVAKIAADRRPIFKALPTVPELEIGNWPGSTFDDASANSGEDIVSRVVAQATGSDGRPLRVKRSHAMEPARDVYFQNPGFEADLAGWTMEAGTQQRVTANQADGVAAMQLTSDSGGNVAVSGAIVGTMVAGRSYRVRVKLAKASANTSSWGSALSILLRAGTTALAEAYLTNLKSLLYSQYVYVDFAVSTTVEQWVTAGRGSLSLRIASYGWPASTAVVLVDGARVEGQPRTVVDRRGFVRTRTLPISAPMTEEAMQQIGDVYLSLHRATPLRGSGTVDVGGCRRIATGEVVHPARLLRYTSELMQLSHRVDPDTGEQGRTAVIQGVSYSHNDERASVTFDSDRRRLDHLLARYAAVVG